MYVLHAHTQSGGTRHAVSKGSRSRSPAQVWRRNHFQACSSARRKWVLFCECAASKEKNVHAHGHTHHPKSPSPRRMVTANADHLVLKFCLGPMFLFPYFPKIVCTTIACQGQIKSLSNHIHLDARCIPISLSLSRFFPPALLRCNPDLHTAQPDHIFFLALHPPPLHSKLSISFYHQSHVCVSMEARLICLFMLHAYVERSLLLHVVYIRGMQAVSVS
jgi:hypothetical protein